MKDVLEGVRTKDGYSQGTHRSKGTEAGDSRRGKPVVLWKIEHPRPEVKRSEARETS